MRHASLIAPKVSMWTHEASEETGFFFFFFSPFFFAEGLQNMRFLAKPKSSSCIACHDLRSVLPKEHTPVSGKDITACLNCHPPGKTAKLEPNPYSARIHRAHIGSKSKVDCFICHTWVPGKSFGLVNRKISWAPPPGRPWT